MRAGKATAGWITPRSEPNRTNVAATPSTPANLVTLRCYVAVEFSSLDPLLEKEWNLYACRLLVTFDLKDSTEKVTYIVLNNVLCLRRIYLQRRFDCLPLTLIEEYTIYLLGINTVYSSRIHGGNTFLSNDNIYQTTRRHIPEESNLHNNNRKTSKHTHKFTSVFENKVMMQSCGPQEETPSFFALWFILARCPMGILAGKLLLRLPLSLVILSRTRKMPGHCS
jgi:hypothetical protein